MIVEWLSLLLRWLHVITGIAWIGSSFYFIWLDNSLSPPKSDKDIKDGVAGDLWAVHGGGFYHKKKYKTAPAHMPEHLHWFKWEAYFTWMSGFLLLAVIYYYGAETFLIDRAKADFTRWQAVLTGLGFIAGGWIFYDGLCRSRFGKSNKVFGYLWFGALTLAAYALCHVFTGRGAFIHIGAMIGTAMAANVFMIIIPSQRKAVAALLAGKAPDPALGARAKQRSLHNNYMTLPVLLIMIGNHYPMLFAHEYNWLVLAALSASSWPIRQFFNLKHKGKEDYGYLAAGAAGILLVALFSSEKDERPVDMGVTDAEVRTIVRVHCSGCHSDTPVDGGLTQAPQGVMFDTMDEIRKYAARIKQQAVETQTMPMGNETAMTEEERKKLGDWIDRQLPR